MSATHIGIASGASMPESRAMLSHFDGVRAAALDNAVEIEHGLVGSWAGSRRERPFKLEAALPGQVTQSPQWAAPVHDATR